MSVCVAPEWMSAASARNESMCPVVTRIDWLDKVNRRTERLVDPMAERVHLGGLTRPGQNHGAAWARFQIGGCGAREVQNAFGQFCIRHGGAEFAGDDERHIAYQFRAQRYAMIRQCAGKRPRGSTA